jgi:hypothetical protein
MKKLITIAAAVLLSACSSNSTDPGRSMAVVNAGFEQTASDGSIPGWILEQHGGPPSYEMVIDAQGASEGHGSFRMTRTHDQVYGTIKQSIAVGDAEGKWVELTAMMKTKDVGPKGWKLMILGKGVREFSPAITGTSDWQRVKVRAQLPPKGTSSIFIGATLLDGGSGWLDNVELKVAQ